MFRFTKIAFALALLTILTVVAFTSATNYFSDAKLHPNCLKAKPTPSLTAEWGMQLFAGAGFYIPFGNSKAIQHISQLIFPGREVTASSSRTTTTTTGGGNNTTQQGSQNGCVLVRIKGFKLQMEGHGDHILTQDCSVITKGVNHCVVNSNSEDPNVQKNGDGIFTIVWTDNAQSMAVVRCTDDGLYNDWYVFSFHTSLNETVKETILSRMNSLGFPDTMEDTTTNSYEGCELFDPEEDD